MTRNQNHDHDGAPWSDVNHDVLLLVMIQLGFVDFFAFSGVCKSWRSFALSNRKWFMASKPPMSIWRDDDGYCYLKDFEGRRFKTILPHSVGRICYGVTRGYLILMGKETRDFWLVNPIKRRQLRFPELRMLLGAREVYIRAVLVFSRSISGWVFVVLHTTKSRLLACKPKLSFYIHGKEGWNHVSSIIPILDIHFFKGKIYTLHRDCSLGELRLYPNQKRKWTLLETMNYPKQYLFVPELVSSGENLYLISRYLNIEKVMEVEKVMELDIGEMKWVMPQKTIQEYAFFIDEHTKSSAAMKLESLAGPHIGLESYADFVDEDEWMFYHKRMWYFPHDCLSVNSLDE